jgi:hypothetical protein
MSIDAENIIDSTILIKHVFYQRAIVMKKAQPMVIYMVYIYTKEKSAALKIIFSLTK